MRINRFTIEKDDPNQPNYFDFARVKERLFDSFSYAESLRYVLNIKTEFVQQRLNKSKINHSPNFEELCDSEITRLKMMMEIERYNGEEEFRQQWKMNRDDLHRTLIGSKTPKSIIPNKKSIKELRHKDLTVDRATLFFNYLFDFAEANCHNTDKARTIALLTSFDDEKIRQQLSGINKKAYSNFFNFENDMKIVRGLFEILGLSEIAQTITNDLRRLEKETEKDF